LKESWMTVNEMVQQAELEVKAGADRLDAEVTGGFSGDLISAVMANANQGNVWVTWHVHPNIVAAAVVTKLAGVIIVSSRQLEEETIQKAQQEGIPILVSKLPAFETIGRLHSIGIPGA
jgi:hypothetical protein